MFYVNDMPWWIGTSHDHGQATELGDHPTWEQARVPAGLDWDPVESDLFKAPDLLQMRDKFARIMMNAELTPVQMLDRLVIAGATSAEQVEGWKHVGRSDDEAATLACTQLSYSVIANSEFGNIFEALLEQENVQYETGGCLDGGRQVWMLARLDEPIVLPGDDTVTYPFISLMSRHDARGSTAARTTNVRVVCGNTFDYAELEGERTGLVYRFVHRANWRDHLDEAREAVTGVRKQARAYEELSRRLLLVPVSEDQKRLVVAEFFPMPPRGEASDRVIRNVDTSRARLNEIFASATVRGACGDDNAYGIMQGIGEYCDHARQSRSWETKVGRTLLKPEPLKARALQILGEVCDIDLKPVKAQARQAAAELIAA
jgi:phage/plasmid-like protein (TIGR03299 family)